MNRYLIKLALLLPVLISVLSFQQTANADQKKLTFEIEGNKVFAANVVSEKLTACVARYPASQGENNERVLDACVFELIDFMRSRGYLQAKINELKKEESEDELKIIVPIEEGILYRLGKVEIAGATIFTSEQLLALSKLKTGAIGSGYVIADWLNYKVKAAYDDKGYIQYEPDTEVDFRVAPDKPDEGIFDLKVTINEGRCFMVQKIEFVGNERTAEDLLRQSLLIKEDTVFSNKLLVKSIVNLNGLGLFETIDRHRDVKFHTEEDTGSVNLKIQLKEKR